MLKVAFVACLVLAALSVVIGPLSGHWVVGVGICIGLLVGAGNGYAAERLVRTGVPFLATSLLRIVVLTLAAMVAALVMGFSRAWTVVLGVALAQVLLALSAAGEIVRR